MATCAIGAFIGTTDVQADGLVLILNPQSGSFKARATSVSFARHFGPGGEPIPATLDDESAPPSDAGAEGDWMPKRRAIPSGEVQEAIEEVALRYAGHVGLRQADMTVSEWMAFFQSNIEIESGYNQNALSPVGAIGLGQLMPGTAEVLGVDPNDTMQNLDGSARYLLMLLERFGSKELALAGYNAGPEAVAKYNGIPPYDETQGHVKKVMAVYGKLTEGTTE